MKLPERLERLEDERGVIGWVALWMLGVPVSVLAILFLARGCT